MSLLKVATPRPDPPPVPRHARPSLPHVEGPKNLLAPRQIVSQNDGSGPGGPHQEKQLLTLEMGDVQVQPNTY